MFVAVSPKTRLKVLSTALLSISSYLSVFLQICIVILVVPLATVNKKRVLRFNKPLRLNAQHKYTKQITLPLKTESSLRFDLHLFFPSGSLKGNDRFFKSLYFNFNKSIHRADSNVYSG